MSDSFAARDARASLLATLVLLSALVLAVSGCNTIQGAGKDVEAAGEAVTGASEDVEEDM